MNKLVFFALLISSLNLFAETMTSDELALTRLSAEITAAEDRGDRKWLEGILAQELAFRRANGVVVGKERFLKDVKPRDSSKTDIESIKLYGKNRAVVTCIVAMKIDGQDAEFHNVRMFIREGKDWKLLGWANERLIKE